MKQPFSIVVVCKNEAPVIKHLLDSTRALTDDVVVYDSGSTDATSLIAKQYPNVRWFEGPWEGFGKTKQHATALAKWDWVLSLDADEALDEALQQALQQLSLHDPSEAYTLPFKNFLGAKQIKWGEWGFDKQTRLFHRDHAGWSAAAVHEELLLPRYMRLKTLHGHVLHRTVSDTLDYSHKVMRYALLNAEKFFSKGRRATFSKRYITPLFTFLKFYIFQLGFLDGWEGLVCARMTAYYTFLKYARLYELRHAQQSRVEKRNEAIEEAQ